MKRKTEVETTYLTLPINLLQKAIIDNTKTTDAMPSRIELEKEEEQIIFTETKTLFIKLSYNV